MKFANALTGDNTTAPSGIPDLFTPGPGVSCLIISDMDPEA
jgi:hypothetical protein